MSENGRDRRGRFAVGNSGGPGNPHARRVAALRSALLESVTEADLRAIVAKLVERAKQGDLVAARGLFDRIFGRPTSMVDLAVEGVVLTEGESVAELRKELLDQPKNLEFLRERPDSAALH